MLFNVILLSYILLQSKFNHFAHCQTIDWGRTRNYGPVGVTRGGSISGGFSAPGGSPLAKLGETLKELTGSDPTFSTGRDSGFSAPYVGTIGKSRRISIGLGDDSTSTFGTEDYANLGRALRAIQERPETLGGFGRTAAAQSGQQSGSNRAVVPLANLPPPQKWNSPVTPALSRPGQNQPHNAVHCLVSVQYINPTTAFPNGGFLDQCGRVIPAELLLGAGNSRLNPERFGISTGKGSKLTPAKKGEPGPSFGPGPESITLPFSFRRHVISSTVRQTVEYRKQGQVNFPQQNFNDLPK